MNRPPRIIIDNNIPFLKGRLEPVADCVYTDQHGFTPELVRDADAMIIRTRTRCDRALLEGSRVRFIATATIGMDQFDLDWCREAGITVRNAPGCNAPGVAQYVWSALLRAGFDPAKHTLALIGRGNVGTIVAEWGRALGARILVADPPRAEQGLTDEDYRPMREIIAQADAVTLHTPYTRTGNHPTHHLIGAPEIELMRPGTILVNAARGPVADNHAVKEAVAAGRLRAIIDTWEGEPDADPELIQLAETATFHIAGYSAEGKQRATRMALESLAQYFGLDIDTSGLAPAYKPGNPPSAQAILSSYDPRPDSDALKSAPHLFDQLRADYHYRNEPRQQA